MADPWKRGGPWIPSSAEQFERYRAWAREVPCRCCGRTKAEPFVDGDFQDFGGKWVAVWVHEDLCRPCAFDLWPTPDGKLPDTPETAVDAMAEEIMADVRRRVAAAGIDIGMKLADGTKDYDTKIDLIYGISSAIVRACTRVSVPSGAVCAGDIGWQ